MKKKFHKTGDLNTSNYVKIPLRSRTSNNDKYCFLWWILAGLHPCKSDHPNRVSNYKQYFDELNVESFDYSNGFR